MAASVLHATEHLKVLVAHRPGFVQPALLARKAATLDHLTGGGRIAIHFITGGDEADQRREGDFVLPRRPLTDGPVRSCPSCAACGRRMRRSTWRGSSSGTRAPSPRSSRSRPGGSRSTSPGRRPPPSRWGRPRPMCTPSGASPAPRWPSGLRVIGEVAERMGRSLRYSISLRPIIADHRGRGVGEGGVDRRDDRRTDRVGQGAHGRPGLLPGDWAGRPPPPSPSAGGPRGRPRSAGSA